VREAVEKLYTEMTNAGIDVLLDDRDVRPGFMFADMELIGIPHRVVIGERGLDEGMVEYRGRTDSENSMIELERIISHLKTSLDSDQI
jgi:prolyl-tRNA synthetase